MSVLKESLEESLAGFFSPVTAVAKAVKVAFTVNAPDRRGRKAMLAKQSRMKARYAKSKAKSGFTEAQISKIKESISL